MKKLPKKARKGCLGCKNYQQYFCKLAGSKKDIPQDLFIGNKKCKCFKKNKYVYF